MLSETQKLDVKGVVNLMTDFVDVEELPSARYVRNPYGVDPELIGSSSCWEYDEDDMLNAACELAIERLTDEGLDAYLNWDEIDNDDGTLLKEVVAYIEELER